MTVHRLANPCRVAVLALAGVLPIAAQSAAPANTPVCQPGSKPCPTPVPAGSFPFPGETPNDLPGAPGDTGPRTTPPQTVPAASTAHPTQSGAPASSPAGAPQEAFPFPGETPNDLPGAPGDSSSSSSSSSSSAPASANGAPAQPDDAPESPVPARAAGRRRLPKVEDLVEREAKDLEVAAYYSSTGNHLAAWMRAKDAVGLAPDDPDAHLRLAEEAAALGKLDQAREEYAANLRLDPDGEKNKAARAALARLSR